MLNYSRSHWLYLGHFSLKTQRINATCLVELCRLAWLAQEHIPTVRVGACVHSCQGFIGQNVQLLTLNPLSEEHKSIVQHEWKFGVQRSHNYFVLLIRPNVANLLPFPCSAIISCTKFLTKSRPCDLSHAQQFFPCFT